jgi:ribosome-associated protein
VNFLKNIVHIDAEFITLGQFLKHANLISSGGMAKWFLSEYVVYVDNEKEDRRGRKLYPGAMVEIPGEGTFFIQSTKSDTKEDDHDISESEA